MIETSEFKAQLEQELNDLTSELKTIGIHNPEVPEDWIATPEAADTSAADPNDVADRAEDWAEKRAAIKELEARYNNIVRALKKIENGTYGICEICGEEIEHDRLSANPAARTNKAHINDEGNLPL